MFTTTKDKALLTTTTGALPRPSWYTENLRGIPLSQGFSRLAYRDQHFDCLACHVVGPASRRHRHHGGRRHPARRRRRRPRLGELRHRARRRHRRAARGSAAGRLHGRQGPRRPDVGSDRDPHDAAGDGQDRRDVLAARPRLQGDRGNDRQTGEDRLDLGADPGADADQRALQGPARAADGSLRRAQQGISRYWPMPARRWCRSKSRRSTR